MNKKSMAIIGFVVVVFVIAFWVWSGGGTEENVDILTEARRDKFQVTVTATGELQAKNSIEITGPSNIRLAHIWQMKITDLVDEGTVVKKGEFVAELDKSEITNKIKDVEDEIQVAQSKYTQTRLDSTLTLSQARDDLVNLQYGMEEMQLKMEQSTYEAPSVRRQAEIDYEKAKRKHVQETKNYRTKVDQAIAKMQEVEADLSKHQRRLKTYTEILNDFTILAPADGMVIYAKEWDGKKIVVNSTIGAWDPTVATLPDLTSMESITYVNEVDIQKIQLDQKVEIGLDADPDKKLTGKVTDIANIGEQRPNSDSKVFAVKIEVNEADSTLRPAMTTSNTIIAVTLNSALHIPLECMHAEDSLTFVYKKSGLKTHKQEIDVGIMNENEVTVLAGLKEEDQVYLSVPANADEMELTSLNNVDK